MKRERERKGKVLVGGDFNARTGRKDETIRGKLRGRDKKFKDRKINGEGRKLCEYIRKSGWSMNRDTKGDEEGQ